MEVRWEINAFAGAQMYKPEFDRTVFANVKNLRIESHGRSVSEKDQDGYYSASFTIPAETTAIQIMALPSYGAIDDWDGAKAITVEW